MHTLITKHLLYIIENKEEYPLHYSLDRDFSLEKMNTLLKSGINLNEGIGPLEETPLHIAVRRRRLKCVDALADARADIDAKTVGKKTPFAHAMRRGFQEVAERLAELGALPTLSLPDQLAVSLMKNELSAAQKILKEDPNMVREFQPEDARIFPDLAACGNLEAVQLLINEGVDLNARGLDGGTALHQAVWFGQPEMVTLLIRHGAPINISGDVYNYSPLGWVAHGSINSGGASERQEVYVKIAKTLLAGGASLVNPSNNNDEHGRWLLEGASPAVAEVLKEYGAR